MKIGTKVKVKTSSHSAINIGDEGEITEVKRDGFAVRFIKDFQFPHAPSPIVSERIIFCPKGTLQTCK